VTTTITSSALESAILSDEVQMGPILLVLLSPKVAKASKAIVTLADILMVKFADVNATLRSV
jgi:hypothetical protein